MVVSAPAQVRTATTLYIEEKALKVEGCREETEGSREWSAIPKKQVQ